jgi:CO/xanthine dehydrogenase FAD-binding subunit
MMRDEGPLVPLAGCTDVYVGLNFGTLPAKRFLDLWPLDELRGVRVSDGALSIGALATYTEIIRSAPVRRRLPILAAAAREIGGVQIQNRGTLGGNIANGSPAGDTLPVLAVADATLVLASAGGTRAAQAISKVVMAGIRSDRPRLSLGSVAPTVVRLPRTEAALASGAGIADARRALDAEIRPIDDLRSTAEYRRRVSGNLLEQFWRETAS